MVPDRVLSLPVDQLEVQARVAVRLFPDIPAMMERFARSMADKVRANNEAPAYALDSEMAICVLRAQRRI
jgi:CRP-like cAMP-binding protein